MPRELSLAEIFQLGYYWETKILLTAVKLDLFSVLNGVSQTAPEIAKRLNLDGQALTILMNALVAMRVLLKNGDHFSNTQVSKNHLVKSNNEYIGHLLLLHDAEWENWGKLEDAVRTGCSPVSQHVFETNPEIGANVLTVLHRIGRESGPTFARRLDLKEPRRMLDVGGGAGTNSIAFCQEYSELKATVFDLPQTLEVTKHFVNEAKLENRITFQPGNFHVDPFDGVFDIALMSDILHYQDAHSNAMLVRKVYDHLEDGGRLIIKDRILGLVEDKSCMGHSIRGSYYGQY